MSEADVQAETRHLTLQQRLLLYVLTLPLAALALIAGYLAIDAAQIFLDLGPVSSNEEIAAYLQKQRVGEMINGQAPLVALLFMLLAVSACWPLLEWRPRSLTMLRIGYAAAFFLVLWFIQITVTSTALLYGSGLPDFDHTKAAVSVFDLRWHMLWPLVFILPVLVTLLLTTGRSSVVAIFHGRRPAQPTASDVIVEDLRTHGNDPIYRRSFYGSLSGHILVIIVLPWLLQFWGCVPPYRVPKGSGNPVTAMVKVKKKPKKKKKRLILNMDSDIIFHVPDLDESEIEEDVEEQSQVRYMADSQAVHGKMGAGGGDKGGWPEGMEDGEIRFIRIKHRGSDWDDGLRSGDAEKNVLYRFKKAHGFKTAREGEAYPMRMIYNMPKGYQPPFVYITGDSLRMSSSEQDMLREYLQDGGLLFADAGSHHFHRDFERLMRRVLPGHPLREIADDDVIFRRPHTFPNGAPPLWHHGGKKVKGVKLRDRWTVIYHPGDINDAWKTGHSGVDKQTADEAYYFFENVLWYSFTHYLEMTKKYRR